MQTIPKISTVAEEMVMEATERFRPLFKLDEEAFYLFQQYCIMLDWLYYELEAQGIGVEVNYEEKMIRIDLYCKEIVVCPVEHMFYTVAEGAERFGYEYNEDGELVTFFEFASVWKHISREERDELLRKMMRGEK